MYLSVNYIAYVLMLLRLYSLPDLDEVMQYSLFFIIGMIQLEFTKFFIFSYPLFLCSQLHILGLRTHSLEMKALTSAELVTHLLLVYLLDPPLSSHSLPLS